MADFPDIPIDVSAQEIEDLIREKIPDEKLANRYWKKFSLNPANSYSDLDNIFDDSDAPDAIYGITFSALSPMYSIVGDGSFIGFINTGFEILLLLNTTNGEWWKYVRGSSELEKVSSDDIEDLLEGKANWEHSLAPITSEQMEEAFLNGIYTNRDLIGYLEGSADFTPKLIFNFLTNGGFNKQLEFSIDENFGEIQAYERHENPDVDYGKVWSDWQTLKYKRTLGGSGSGEGDFIYAGTFNNSEELFSYNFEKNKVYMLYIGYELSNEINGPIPSGRYIGHYEGLSPGINEILFLQPFVFDEGFYYTLNVVSSLDGQRKAIATSEYHSTDLRPVNGQAVSRALAPINQQLDGLEELLSGI